MRDLNPLFPRAGDPLRFSIDRLTHEELRSSGLEVKILRQNLYQSYKHIKDQATLIPKRAGWLVAFPRWIKSELALNADDLFYEYPYYIIELNILNRDALENHICYTQKNHSQLTLGKRGETLGFLAFNENVNDKDWLNVKALYIAHKYKRLGFGTFLVKAVAGLGLSNNKKGVEFNDPFFYGNSSFYRHKGMELIEDSPRHRYGCAQLRFIKYDGSKNTLHQLLPVPLEYPLEFKKIEGADPMALL